MRITPFSSLILLAALLAACNPLAQENGSKVGDRFHPGITESGPNPASAMVDGDIVTSTTSAPALSWTASSSDGDAGFGGYEIALGTSPGGSNILSWTSVGNVTSYTPSVGFTLIDGATYYGSVRAYGLNGMKSAAAAGDGFVVNSLAATFSCDWMSGLSTDCYANPYISTARPLMRFYRTGGANTSPGTYVNSSGVISSAPTNLLAYSEDFSGANWSKITSSVTSSATTAPDGSSNATKIVEDTTNAQHILYKGRTGSNETVTWSIYAKAAERGYALLQLSNFTSAAASATFDLSTCGAIWTSLASADYGAATGAGVSVGNGWCRISVTAQKGSINTTNNPAISPIENPSSGSYLGDGASGIYVWGAQFEQGSATTPYIYTSGTANYGPRLDHDPAGCSGGACTRRGLLIEESRANKALYSSDLSNAAYTRANSVTATGSTDNAPDGTTTAATVTDSVNAYAILQQDAAATDGQTWTASAYVKKDSNQSRLAMLQLQFTGGTTNLWQQIYINTATGSYQLAGTTATGGVVNAGTYWRVYVTGTNNSTGNNIARWGIYPAIGTTMGVSDTTTTGSVVAWGAQLEQGSFPTSYIPTTSAALTRQADDATVLQTSPWMNAAAGTMVGKATTGLLFNNSVANQLASVASLENGSNDRLQIRRGPTGGASTDGTTSARVVAGGVAGFNATGIAGSWPILSARTVGLAYQANDFSSYAEGQSNGFGTSGAVPAVSQCKIGNGSAISYFNGWIQYFRYYDTRLNDNQLKYLTVP